MADRNAQDYRSGLVAGPEWLMLDLLADRCEDVGLTTNLVNGAADCPPVLLVEWLALVVEVGVCVRLSVIGPTWDYWINTWDYCLTSASHPLLAADTLAVLLRAKHAPRPSSAP